MLTTLHNLLKSTHNLFTRFFNTPMNIKIEQNSPQTLISLFTDFDIKMNKIHNSGFQQHIKHLSNACTIKLKTNNSYQGVITINFLYFPQDTSYITTLVHVIHVFTSSYPYNYSDLFINICLDHLKRTIPDTNLPYSSMVKKTRQDSTAFNTSGVTVRSKNTIYITKKQECVKLLIHELCHYVKMDYVLLSIQTPHLWDISSDHINVSESYTETVAVILTTCYNSINLSLSFLELLNKEISYSVYLTIKLLRLYCSNPINFFTSKTQRYENEIQVWEYIIGRTNLLLNLDSLLDCLNNTLYVSESSALCVASLATSDSKLINLLPEFENMPQSISMSYMLLDTVPYRSL